MMPNFLPYCTMCGALYSIAFKAHIYKGKCLGQKVFENQHLGGQGEQGTGWFGKKTQSPIGLRRQQGDELVGPWNIQDGVKMTSIC